MNEAGSINCLLRHLHSLPFDGKMEVMVVDGDPGGSTINGIPANSIMTARSVPGRAAQVNRGAALATGRILLFLHADTMLPEQGLMRIAETMQDSRYVGGAFDLGFETDRKIFRITERYVALRTRITRIPFGDQAIFITKNYFERIGGFCDIPQMEDVEMMRRIRRLGC